MLDTVALLSAVCTLEGTDGFCLAIPLLVDMEVDLEFVGSVEMLEYGNRNIFGCASLSLWAIASAG